MEGLTRLVRVDLLDFKLLGEGGGTGGRRLARPRMLRLELQAGDLLSRHGAEGVVLPVRVRAGHHASGGLGGTRG